MSGLEKFVNPVRSVTSRSPPAALWKFNHRDSLASQFRIYIDRKLGEHFKDLFVLQK